VGVLIELGTVVASGFSSQQPIRLLSPSMSIITCRCHRSRDLPTFFNSRSSDNFFSYIGGSTGSWRITSVQTLSGPALRSATHVEIAHRAVHRPPAGASWILSGVVKNTRFVTREERPVDPLRHHGTNNREATCAALIPIRKSAAWWNLAHEEREGILEEQSRHFLSGLRIFPAIAKRLLYGRDLGEPFDVVTWLEYAPCDEVVFNELAAALRISEERKFVEREIDIRLVRES